MLENMKQYQDYAPLLLRIGVGLVFIIAGWGKLTGLEGTAGFFENEGIPLPQFSALLVGVVEFVGGLMVLLGFYIRIPALLLAIVMLVAIFTVKLPEGWGGDGWTYDFLLLLMCLSLLFMDEGKVSVAQMMGKDSS